MDIIIGNRDKLVITVKHLSLVMVNDKERVRLADRTSFFPEAILVTISPRDCLDLTVYDQLNQRILAYNNDENCKVYVDIPNRVIVNDFRSSDDLYEERLRRYNEIHKDLSKVDKLRQKGYKIDSCKIPQIDMVVANPGSAIDPVRNTLSRSIRIVAKFCSRFYKEFYIKGLLESSGISIDIQDIKGIELDRALNFRSLESDSQLIFSFNPNVNAAHHRC